MEINPEQFEDKVQGCKTTGKHIKESGLVEQNHTLMYYHTLFKRFSSP